MNIAIPKYDAISGKTLHYHIHEKAKAYTERQSIQIMEQVN